MKLLFDNLSNKVSKLTTTTYSTSFSLGIYFLDVRFRKAIYAIYGFVRFADEIVDSFGDYDRKNLLMKFKRDTYEAIDSGISLNPVLNSFQHAVNEYQIDLSLVETFLQSMEMDLTKIAYNDEKFKEYILGSAEVVGLMCLHVFCEGNKERYEMLKPYAMKLGAAFQKVNFLRDMKDDYSILGRTYFPYVNMNAFTCDVKQQIEADIEQDFKEALAGIKKLPASSKSGVYLAYIYYRSLFNKIRRMPAHRVLEERIRINNPHKFSLMFNSLVRNKLNWI